MVLSSLSSPGGFRRRRPRLFPAATACGASGPRRGVGQCYSRLRAGPEPSCLIAPGPSWSDITRPDDPRVPWEPPKAYEGLASALQAASSLTTRILSCSVRARAHSGAGTRLREGSYTLCSSAVSKPRPRGAPTAHNKHRRLESLTAKKPRAAANNSRKTARGCKQQPQYIGPQRAR